MRACDLESMIALGLLFSRKTKCAPIFKALRASEKVRSFSLHYKVSILALALNLPFMKPLPPPISPYEGTSYELKNSILIKVPLLHLRGVT